MLPQRPFRILSTIQCGSRKLDQLLLVRLQLVTLQHPSAEALPATLGRNP